MTRAKILLCCLFSLLALPVLAQEEGIVFFKGSWKKVLAEAKKSNKLIFVDVYTDWCGPCKQMEKEIFPLRGVGEKYNTHFVNYRIDAEKGEGRFLSKAYDVKSYPTYLYFNGEGELVFRAKGYSPNPKRFLALGDTALRFHHSKETIVSDQAAYENRKQDKAFVAGYLKKLTRFGMSEDTISKVLDHFYSQLTPLELKDTATAALLLNSLTTVQSPVFEYVISNQSFYRSFAKQLPTTLGNVVLNSYMKAIGKKNDVLFKAASAASNKVENPSLKYPYSVFLFENQYYLTTKQTDEIIKRAPAFMDSTCRITEKEMAQRDQLFYDQVLSLYTTRYLDSTTVPFFSREKLTWRNNYSKYVAVALNKTADVFLQYAQQKEDLKKACTWAARSVNLQPDNHSFYAVLAKLYAKTGMKQEAMATMKTAIDLAHNQKAPEMAIQAYEDALKKL
ncbi:thioredoxin family protein [Chitinophaga niabensis]|uniref:thioredoxin family protein n=1 Tax=Chitinophaga niabensis TaxID=536979 RepID=UPI0031BB817C